MAVKTDARIDWLNSLKLLCILLYYIAPITVLFNCSWLRECCNKSLCSSLIDQLSGPVSKWNLKVVVAVTVQDRGSNTHTTTRCMVTSGSLSNSSTKRCALLWWVSLSVCLSVCWFARLRWALSDPYYQSRCLSVILSGVLARSPTSGWPIWMKLGS